MSTIRAFLASAARLRDRGTEGLAAHPQEIWALGCHVLARPLARLLAVDSTEPLSAQDEARWRELIARRVAGEPLAYLLGYTEFWSLTLRVTPAVLVPRPETEMLVERALELGPRAAPLRYADIGTGSGAIALALKKECPEAVVIGFDKSLAALAVAHTNSRDLGLDVLFVASDWLSAVKLGQFDVIISNPPYIESTDPCLCGEGLRYEPRSALDGGVDGLAALRSVIAAAIPALRPGGRLLLEHGATQGPATTDLLRRAGFQDTQTRIDYAGHPRLSEGVFHG
ncbi:MAG TPA: peptide chain release factor N(5)-glutamine methyltransferase [Acidiferrobacter sp.]|nr:peptide chain release factor N(5)-glutamine methyltransferase [Acidiferrobacter sp.]